MAKLKSDSVLSFIDWKTELIRLCSDAGIPKSVVESHPLREYYKSGRMVRSIFARYFLSDIL